MTDGPGARPDPAAELRLTALATLRGANYWSRRAVTRLDLAVGAYDEISSADVPEVLERLHGAMPGLVEHQCSVGERGGFLTRLRRGTYAPHIVEHVALELQSMIGHEAGYGRTRGGDVPGEYTVAFEHRHEGVGLRAAALALDVVRRAFAGTLGDVAHEVAELAAVAATPDAPPISLAVLCGVTGGALRAEARAELARRGAAPGALVVDVAPSYLLWAGLPYARSELAVVLDVELRDVPERYREPDRAERLAGVLADAVRPDGLLVAPATARDLQAYARDAGCRVAVFSADGPPARRDRALASLAGWTSRGRLLCEGPDGVADHGPLRADVAPVVQLATMLAATALPTPAATPAGLTPASHATA